MLWGISVRFQTLSLMQRQVAHALLTRPPLSYINASRRINLNNSVRLECVMHAASVHPEPGSNSRKNFISDTRRCLTSSRAIYLSFTFCLSSILNKLWRDQYLHLQCFVLLSCCSIFNDRTVLSCGQLDYYITSLPLCQYLFSNFFKKFFRVSTGTLCNIFAALSLFWGESLSIIPLLSRFVNSFFEKISI